MSERGILLSPRPTLGPLGDRASGSGPAFGVLVYLLSRAATLVAAGRDRADHLHVVDRHHPRPLGRGLVPHPSSATGIPRSSPRAWGSPRRAASRSSPAIPSLIRALSTPFGLSPVFVGCAVSLLAGLAATVGLWQLAVRLSDEGTADRSVVLFAFFPSAFVLSMVYADALFVVPRGRVPPRAAGQAMAGRRSAAAGAGSSAPPPSRSASPVRGAPSSRSGTAARGGRSSRPRSRRGERSSTWGTSGSTRETPSRSSRSVAWVGEPHGRRSLEHPRRPPASGREAPDVLRRGGGDRRRRDRGRSVAPDPLACTGGRRRLRLGRDGIPILATNPVSIPDSSSPRSRC